MSLKEVTNVVPQAFRSLNSEDTLSILMQTTEYFQIDFRTFVQATSQKATKKNDEESLAGTGSGDKTLGMTLL